MNIGIKWCDLLDELIIETSVANKSLFGMQILMESLSNNRVTIDTDSYLLKHCIDVGIGLLFSTFRHYYHTPSSIFDVSPNILYLLGIKWQPWTTQQKQVTFLHFLEVQIRFINLALQKRKNGCQEFKFEL